MMNIWNILKKNGKKYFLNKMLYYSFNEKEIRTNNFLENYNGQIKKRLEGKKLLNWSEYIIFLLNEEKKYKDILNNNKCVKNDGFYEYNNTKSYDLNNNNLQINNFNIIHKNKITNNKLYWFKWFDNSCRFDCFSLILTTVYYKSLKEHSDNKKDITNLLDFVDNIIHLTNNEKKLGIWNYFQNNIKKNYFNLGINISKYKILDVIASLFNLLKNNKICCIII